MDKTKASQHGARMTFLDIWNNLSLIYRSEYFKEKNKIKEPDLPVNFFK